jgi:hypothetical protein
MKTLSVLLVSVLLNANLFAVRANEQQKDPFMTRTFAAASIRAVEATTSGGSITVSGDAGSQATVEVFVSGNKMSEEEIKQVLEENYAIDVKVEGGKLCVVAKSINRITNWNKQGLSISFKISVPKQVNSNLQTSGGSIRIAGLSGAQDFKTSGGSLTVENVSGNIVGKTSGGSINVSDANDVIHLTTSGGSITAKDCNGKINLKTSGGSIKMSHLDGVIDASTSGGSISADDVSGTLKTGTAGGSVKLTGISGSVDAKTSGGSMNVEMELVSDYVKLSNSGNTNLSLPAGKGYTLKVRANKIETSGLKDFRGNVESRSMEGTVGNGGPEIDVKTSQRASLSFQ